MKLSVIIPAYNEEQRLPKTLPDIDNYLRKQTYDYEILIVNDGSKNHTYEVMKSFEPRIKNLRIIGHKANPDYPKNRGKGYATRYGMLKARGDYRIFMDADNSTTIDQIEKMWPEFENGFDIVIGSRDIKDAVLDPPQSWHRRVTGDIFNFLVQSILGLWGIWDTQCGFKGFTKEATENIFPKCKIEQFAFDPEILVTAKKLGYKIKEIPVHWEDKTRSTVKFKSMVKMLKDLLRIRANIIAGKYE